MAQLLEIGTNRSHPIRAHHTFGRNTEIVDTPLANPAASRIHASLEWSGSGWLARDVSRNGTWLGETRLPVRKSVPVNTGQILYFGIPGEGGWELIDDGPPRSMLMPTGEAAPNVELVPYLFLPNERAPELVISYSQSRKCWMVRPLFGPEDAQVDSPLVHRSTLHCGELEWTVFLAETADATELHPEGDAQLSEFEFVFDLSLDEENTELRLLGKDQILDLGERSHHYLLLHLARWRAVEAARGLDQKSQGWIQSDQLTRDIGVEMPHINILIYRAKQQLAQYVDHSMDLNELVERGRGRMRFGCPRFKIYKGQSLTHMLPLAESNARQ